jgi:U3 small nucleolar RNA-associated protein 25
VYLSRKSIKLYSEFYSSDIIISSPIGLVTLINEAETAKKEEKDTDFLTSIENWSHVLTVFEHLNRIPTNQHGTDFMRIREWYLNGHARHYRQTIVLSAFPDAGVNALFSRSCVNHASKVKLRCEYTGVLSKVVLQVRQVIVLCNFLHLLLKHALGS